MLKFLELQFKNFISLFFYSGLIIVAIGTILLIITKNMQMGKRIARNSLVTITGYIFMVKDHKSSLELNKSILLVYIVFQIFYFENLLIFTSNNRMVGFSVMSHI